MAEKAGVAPSTVTDIETHQRLPNIATLARLAAALAVAAGWLAFGLGDQETDGPAASAEGMGARLAAVRGERGITKAALARIVGLSPGTVGDIEKGAQTGVDVLESLAAALTVSPAWLAYNQGPQQILNKRRTVSHNDSSLGTSDDRR